MNKVLLVGENPNGFTGNGLMMKGILAQFNDTYDLTVFCPFSDIAVNPDESSFCRFIPSDDIKRQDLWGRQKLLNLLDSKEFNFVVMVGIDIWRYIEIIAHVKQIQRKNHFQLVHIFPYELQYLDSEFVQYSNLMDIPCVYSKYGFDMLKLRVPKLRYFRPPMFGTDLFYPYDDQKRDDAKSGLYPTMSPGTFVYGFIGPNQIRKDPQKLIKAFSILKETELYNKKAVLYMHTDFKNGVYNLQRYAMSCGLESGDLLVKPEGSYSPFERMPDIYNSFDCFVNPSMQEGLSWTVIQAMLCGVPVLATDSTAHIELLHEIGGNGVPCNSPAYIPISTSQGQSWIDAKSCTVEDLAEGMLHVYAAGKAGRILATERSKKMVKWCADASNITDVVKTVPVKLAEPLTRAILFMQHSSAGDILMTTRCLKRIRDKHKGLPLYYMTQKQFFGILENNPDVQGVIDWNPELAKTFQVVYNPHGEHILRGGFNNLDVKLADMYPYFCKVEPGDFFIHCEKPTSKLFAPIPEPYIIVHTTGGAPKYRTYAHMGTVIRGFQLPVVQVGSKTDLYCPGSIDLRGMLSFTETAWVMKNASAAIVIDSFPSHLAGALGTPCIVLYGPAPARVVGPIHKDVPDSLWFDMEPNKLDVCPDMTNCHGNSKTCMSPCINSINPMEIKENLIKILQQVIPDV